MSAFKKSHLSLSLTAACLLAISAACRKPAPAPQPKPAAPAAAPVAAKTDDTARRNAEAEQKRKAEEAAEAARKAEALKEAEYRKAAEAALKDVHFDYDRSDLREGDKPVLAAIAAFMKTYPRANVFIDGNCDERGTGEYNLALGERRARAVMTYLVNLGVPENRLSTTSYGKERPVCKESTESCWSRNRRAHFSLM